MQYEAKVILNESPVFLEWLKVSEKENYKPEEVVVEEKVEEKKEQEKAQNKNKKGPETTGKKEPTDNKK